MKLLTVSEAAAIVQLHPHTVQRLCKQGQMPGARKFGRVWRIDPKQLTNSDTIPSSPNGRHPQGNNRIEGWR